MEVFGDIIPHCVNKKKYPTEDHAIAAVGPQIQKWGRLLRPYKCRDCENWHLTSQLNRRKYKKV